MEIINWAECDQMLIHTTIGLRYETEPDQLRYVLVKLHVKKGDRKRGTVYLFPSKGNK